MAPISLKVRFSTTDEIDAEIDDTETVEALAVVVYSMRPALGEELRILHKGRLLKSEAILAAAGVQSGDQIAVARKPAPKAAAEAPEVETPAPVQTETAPAPAAQPSLQFEPPSRTDDGEPKKKSPRLEEPEKSSEVQAEVAGAAEAAPASPPAAAEAAASPEIAAENAEEPQPADPAPSSPAPSSPSRQQASYPEVDVTSSAGLLAFAALLEGGTESPPPEKLAEMLKETASKMQVLEGTMKEFAQALQMVNMISATGLRSGMAAINGEATPESSPTGAKEEETGRSFLVKRGDADLQEAHQKAAQPMYRQTSGGACSEAAVSKEEMAKQRQARLAMLEKKQQEKQKEKDEADERYRAREAMFTRKDEITGKAKPAGKP
jgi:hypothetical protein